MWKRCPVSTEAAAGPRRLAGPLWVGALLILLAFLVIYPLLMLLFGAFSDSNPVVDGFGNFKPSLKHFLDVLGNENVHLAFFNALAACGGGTMLAVVIGLAFSWIVVRTNTPFKGFIAGASMIPLFVPPLVAGVAWGILGSPKTGLLNIVLKWLGIDFRFNFYSMAGPHRRVRHLLRALRLHVHRLGAAQHGSEPRGGLGSVGRHRPSPRCSPSPSR